MQKSDAQIAAEFDAYCDEVRLGNLKPGEIRWIPTDSIHASVNDTISLFNEVQDRRNEFYKGIRVFHQPCAECQHFGAHVPGCNRGRLAEVLKSAIPEFTLYDDPAGPSGFSIG